MLATHDSKEKTEKKIMRMWGGNKVLCMKIAAPFSNLILGISLQEIFEQPQSTPEIRLLALIFLCFLYHNLNVNLVTFVQIVYLCTLNHIVIINNT